MTSFNERKNLKHYRITNKRDIIPSMPIYKYYHTGDNIKIKNKSFHCSKKSNNSMIKNWKIKDHLSSSYYKNLKLISW